jgi:hypothetical protein
MKRKRIGVIVFVGVFLCVLVALAMAAQDKYTLKVPNGLSFSEFRGYEAWQVVSISQDGSLIAAILGNPAMIKAYSDGAPSNGEPFPDGAKMAKVHWNPKKLETFPAATVPQRGRPRTQRSTRRDCELSAFFLSIRPVIYSTSMNTQPRFGGVW